MSAGSVPHVPYVRNSLRSLGRTGSAAPTTVSSAAPGGPMHLAESKFQLDRFVCPRCCDHLSFYFWGWWVGLWFLKQNQKAKGREKKQRQRKGTTIKKNNKYPGIFWVRPVVLRGAILVLFGLRGGERRFIGWGVLWRGVFRGMLRLAR